jgi:hypothetical protein|tara:strand:+ start:29865 stop:30107 length:243 start_codon:yes stop_codon:yes gene_type:complete
MSNIENLLTKALQGKQGGVTPWYENISKEAKPFIDGIEQMIKEGKKPNASSVTRILNEELGVKVSRSRVSAWMYKLDENE